MPPSLAHSWASPLLAYMPLPHWPFLCLQMAEDLPKSFTPSIPSTWNAHPLFFTWLTSVHL